MWGERGRVRWRKREGAGRKRKEGIKTRGRELEKEESFGKEGRNGRGEVARGQTVFRWCSGSV